MSSVPSAPGPSTPGPSAPGASTPASADDAPAAEDAIAGGGWPLIDGWARATLSPSGLRLWQTLNHKSACLSCAWGTGGQNGGFRDELGEPLQRCLKSVEAIQAELMPAVPRAGRCLPAARSRRCGSSIPTPATGWAGWIGP
jgi:hypothetical protein